MFRADEAWRDVLARVRTSGGAAAPLPDDLENDARRVYEWWGGTRGVPSSTFDQDWADLTLQVIDFLARLRAQEQRGAQLQ